MMLSIIAMKPMVSTMLTANLLLTPQWLPLQNVTKQSAMDPILVPISSCDGDSRSKQCVVDQIKRYADLYGVPKDLALDVADCESDFRANVYGDGGRAYGTYQFHKKTFELFSKKLGEKLDYFDLEDNIRLAIWALANDRGHHWSCYKKVASR